MVLQLLEQYSFSSKHLRGNMLWYKGWSLSKKVTFGALPLPLKPLNTLHSLTWWMLAVQHLVLHMGRPHLAHRNDPSTWPRIGIIIERLQE